MTLVDPYDDSIVRYVIRRHQYDPETNHFRWFYESAFDNKREYRRKLQCLQLAHFDDFSLNHGTIVK